MSDTPRTDTARQAYADYKSGYHQFLIDGKWIEQPNGWEFARTLERELMAPRLSIGETRISMESLRIFEEARKQLEKFRILHGTTNFETAKMAYDALCKEREWRPIETAPTGGTRFVVTDGFCVEIWWRIDHMGFVAGDRLNPTARNPDKVSGWLPLPDTQAITGGEG